MRRQYRNPAAYLVDVLAAKARKAATDERDKDAFRAATDGVVDGVELRRTSRRSKQTTLNAVTADAYDFQSGDEVEESGNEDQQPAGRGKGRGKKGKGDDKDYKPSVTPRDSISPDFVMTGAGGAGPGGSSSKAAVKRKSLNQDPGAAVKLPRTRRKKSAVPEAPNGNIADYLKGATPNKAGEAAERRLQASSKVSWLSAATAALPGSSNNNSRGCGVVAGDVSQPSSAFRSSMSQQRNVASEQRMYRRVGSVYICLLSRP